MTDVFMTAMIQELKAALSNIRLCLLFSVLGTYVPVDDELFSLCPE